MKKVITAALWIGGTILFALLIGWAQKFDQDDCEGRVARELNTTAVYVNGHCMVKGYGRFDGR